jgi:hypothetical protein
VAKPVVMEVGFAVLVISTDNLYAGKGPQRSTGERVNRAVRWHLHFHICGFTLYK